MSAMYHINAETLKKICPHYKNLCNVEPIPMNYWGQDGFLLTENQYETLKSEHHPKDFTCVQTDLEGMYSISYDPQNKKTKKKETIEDGTEWFKNLVENTVKMPVITYPHYFGASNPIRKNGTGLLLNFGPVRGYNHIETRAISPTLAKYNMTLLSPSGFGDAIFIGNPENRVIQDQIAEVFKTEDGGLDVFCLMGIGQMDSNMPRKLFGKSAEANTNSNAGELLTILFEALKKYLEKTDETPALTEDSIAENASIIFKNKVQKAGEGLSDMIRNIQQNAKSLSEQKKAERTYQEKMKQNRDILNEKSKEFEKQKENLLQHKSVSYVKIRQNGQRNPQTISIFLEDRRDLLLEINLQNYEVQLLKKANPTGAYEEIQLWEIAEPLSELVIDYNFCGIIKIIQRILKSKNL